jgi:hypothetical protein
MVHKVVPLGSANGATSKNSIAMGVNFAPDRAEAQPLRQMVRSGEALAAEQDRRQRVAAGNLTR